MKIGKMNKKAVRKKQGSVLVINLFAMLAFFALLLNLQDYLTALVGYTHANNALQSSAICAARAISRIVVEDPAWGFISLSDHAANGERTIAGDGEALPVMGINTISNTVRLEKLLAEKLGACELNSAADEDYRSLHEASGRLKAELKKSIGSGASPLTDIYGKKISPYQEALELFKENMPELRCGNAVLKSFKISLGRLSDSSSTITRIPENGGDEPGARTFPSFKNCPVGARDFYFAGISERPRLVDSSRFALDDNKMFCSVVLIEAEISVYSPLKAIKDGAPVCTLKVSAAALPGSEKDECASGSLLINFPQGTVSEFKNIKEMLLRPEFAHTVASSKIAADGDFPDDPQAKLLDQAVNSQMTLCQYQSRAFCDWLHTTHGKVKLDSLLKAVEQPFAASGNSNSICFVYSVDGAAECQVREINNSGSLKRTVSDGQTYQFRDRVFPTSRGSLGICIRDEVANQGGKDAGKHGGQPILGELPSISAELANELNSAARLTSGLRRSYCQGGLAVCLEFFLTNG